MVFPVEEYKIISILLKMLSIFLETDKESLQSRLAMLELLGIRKLMHLLSTITYMYIWVLLVLIFSIAMHPFAAL